MPALSPTMSEGVIAKWNIPEGGKVSVGDVICEIQTDKATVGYESQEEGYIAKILQQEGAKAEVGGLIGIMVEEEEDIAKVNVNEIIAGEGTKKAVEKAPETTTTAATPEPVKRSTGSDEFADTLHEMIHSGKYKVSPASEWWMRTHKILPD